MDFTPAINLIEKSKHIGIILPALPNHDILASAETLATFFISRGVYVGIVTPLDPHSRSRENIIPILASLKPLTKEFIISLNTAASPISQLRYEQPQGHVDIILSPASYSSMRDNVSFRDGKTQCDCLITLGLDDIEAVDTKYLTIPPSLFSETPIIAFASSTNHKKYGTVNLINISLPSIAELTYRFLAAIPNHKISGTSATLLLSGILHATHGLTVLTDAHTLLSGHELVKLGADYTAAHALWRNIASISLAPLMGRALARSKIDTKKQITWSSLIKDDFLLTERSENDIPEIIARIEKEFPGNRFHVFLWQHPTTHNIHAHIAADIARQESVRRSASAESDGPYLRLTDIYESFADAEKKVSALLERIV
ncbi:MAG: hypothetical protein Q8R30_04350 [bacterium]|nr:hypothetical protein [bacterium]